MNEEKIQEYIVEHEGQISRLWESAKSAHKRIDENGRITEGVHKLAANMENLIGEVKCLGEKLENGLREQGQRIGALEVTAIKLTDADAHIDRLDTRIDAMEKEPAQKWKTLTAQVIGLLVAAAVGYFVSGLV